MTECELLPKCLYFKNKLKNMPTVAEGVKMMYCLWHYDECARYKVAKAMGRENVPNDLFPPDLDRAEKLIVQFNQT